MITGGNLRGFLGRQTGWGGYGRLRAEEFKGGETEAGAGPGPEGRSPPHWVQAGLQDRGRSAWGLRLTGLRHLYERGRWQLTLSAPVCLSVGSETLPDLETVTQACLKLGPLVWLLPGEGSRRAGCPAPPQGPGMETDTQDLGRL